jgi:hypothetical protein
VESPEFPRPGIPTPSRRTLLIATPAAALVTSLAAGQTPASAATTDESVMAAFNGLASYVLPGDDEYSRRQARTRPGPGGVAAGAAGHLYDCYQHAFAAAINTKYGVNLPAPQLISAILDAFSRTRYLIESIGPLKHPFANLTHPGKARVLADIDEQPLLRGLPVGFGFNTIITLTGLGCYSEYGVFDQRTRTLTGRPVGWELSNHAGVRNGWPEFIGYWRDVPQVPDVDDRTDDGTGV